MILVGCGDSWGFGAEMYDPNHFDRQDDYAMDLHQLHFDPVHLKYREENRYLGVFNKLIQAEAFVDLTRCAISNDTIVRYLVDWLARRGYLSGKDASDLFISIGWTSPERTEFYYEEKWGTDNYIDMGPHVDESAYKNHPHIKDFSRLYYTHFNSLGGVFHRHINQIKYLELLLDSLNIKYVMHQGFYHYDVWQGFDYLDTDRIKNTALSEMSTGDRIMWNQINPVKFMNLHHETDSTIYNYIKNRVGKDGFYVWHPSELGHKVWAEYMYQYCVDNNLLG